VIFGLVFELGPGSRVGEEGLAGADGVEGCWLDRLLRYSQLGWWLME
jgi:hypothetical protein